MNIIKLGLILIIIFLGHGYLATAITRFFWKPDFNIEDNYFLTFDDGPSEISHDLIELLKRNNKRAIFFLLGQKLESYDLKIYEDFEIACHGYRHVNFALLDPYRTYVEFKKARDAFRKKGLSPKYFRAPYGLYNLTLLFLLKKYHMKVFQWDYLLGDWVLEDEEILYGKIESRAKDSNILVLHDGTEGSADHGAKEQMLKELKKYLNEERKNQKNCI